MTKLEREGTFVWAREKKHNVDKDNIVPIKLPNIKRKEKYEPRGRKNQEIVMVGRINRPTNFGNNRGCIFTVKILVRSFGIVEYSDIRGLDR